MGYQDYVDYKKLKTSFQDGIYDAIGKFLVLLSIGYGIFWVFFHIFMPLDNSDISRFKRSGVKIITDNLTGCQYIYKNGAITPRLNSLGEIIVKVTEDSK